jgi:ATP-dependent Lhr-like helicase
LTGIEDAGRWTLTRRPTVVESDPRERGSGPQKQRPNANANANADADAVETIARTLLRRYGVVCWHLLEREAQWLPPWRELLRVYHRLEARGEIRGGRFIAGLSGEQFALPEAIASLRQVRKRPPDGALLTVSASDPLNLVGTVLTGDKVPRLAGARVAFRDGIALATLVSGEVAMLAQLTPEQAQVVRRRLLREPGSALPAAIGETHGNSVCATTGGG